VRHPHPPARLTARVIDREGHGRAALGASRLLRPAAAVACALVLVSLRASPVPADEAQVVARVNGTPITQGMVNQVVKSLLRERGSTPSSDEIAALNDAALDSLIALELLFQAAQKAGVSVSDQEVAAEIARSKAKLGGDKAFAAALQRSGMTEAALEADTRKTLVVDLFVETRVVGDVHVAPEAVRRFYDEHRQELERDGVGSFEKARPVVEKTLLESERRQRQEAYVDELRKSAHIERPTPREATAP
jgi:acyl carrier protein